MHPNKLVWVNRNDTPWITSDIKCMIRKYKHAFHKVKCKNTPTLWAKFHKLRNETITMIRRNKEIHINKLSENLIPANHSSRNWWSTIKYFMSCNCKESVPSLYDNDTLFKTTLTKPTFLITFFAIRQC